MALKLQCEHRWCVTGTPVQRGVEGNTLKNNTNCFRLRVYVAAIPKTECKHS